MSDLNCDVCICGAGPTGLMLANLLAKSGISFIIVDSKPNPTKESRALVVQARSLEIYEQMGLSDIIIADGEKLGGIVFWRNGKKIADADLGILSEGVSPFPYLMIYEQNKNETLLYNNLRKQNSDVQWNTTFKNYTEQEGNIDIKIEQNNEEKIITARYLVACDGSKSFVREQSKIPFEGGTYENVFYVADTHINAGLQHDKLNLFPSKSSLAVLFPMKGENRFRVIGILPKEYYHKPDMNFDEMINHLEHTANLPLHVYHTAWASTYRIHHKKVSSFKKGRIFFAGDAAHVHSPAGGQGMNTGLQDAYNLAWKLAMVIKQNANEELLETYHEERNPVAAALLKTTDRGFNFMINQNPFYAFLRMQLMLHLLAALLKSKFIKKRIFLLVSQIAIEYKRSTLSKGRSGRIEAGLRFSYCEIEIENGNTVSVYQFFKQHAGNYFLLVDYNLNSEATFVLPQWIKKMSLPVNEKNDIIFQKSGFDKKWIAILRPDNYIGFIASTFNAAEINAYLKIFSNR